MKKIMAFLLACMSVFLVACDILPNGLLGGTLDDGVYCVGEDIAPGRYLFTNVNVEKYKTAFVVFKSQEDYKNFLEDKTYLTYQDVILQNACYSEQMRKGDKIYVNLEEGNIVSIEGGRVKNTAYDISADSKIYSGVYVGGVDIPVGSYKFRSSEIMMYVFENQADYYEYRNQLALSHSEQHVSVLYDYAKYVEYFNDVVTIGGEMHFCNDLYGFSECSFEVKAGMVLVVMGGIGEYYRAA